MGLFEFKFIHHDWSYYARFDHNLMVWMIFLWTHAMQVFYNMNSSYVDMYALWYDDFMNQGFF